MSVGDKAPRPRQQPPGRTFEKRKNEHDARLRSTHTHPVDGTLPNLDRIPSYFFDGRLEPRARHVLGPGT